MDHLTAATNNLRASNSMIASGVAMRPYLALPQRKDPLQSAANTRILALGQAAPPTPRLVSGTTLLQGNAPGASPRDIKGPAASEKKNADENKEDDAGRTKSTHVASEQDTDYKALWKELFGDSDEAESEGCLTNELHKCEACDCASEAKPIANDSSTSAATSGDGPGDERRLQPPLPKDARPGEKLSKTKLTHVRTQAPASVSPAQRQRQVSAVGLTPIVVRSRSALLLPATVTSTTPPTATSTVTTPAVEQPVAGTRQPGELEAAGLPSQADRKAVGGSDTASGGPTKQGKKTQVREASEVRVEKVNRSKTTELLRNPKGYSWLQPEAQLPATGCQPNAAPTPMYAAVNTSATAKGAERRKSTRSAGKRKREGEDKDNAAGSRSKRSKS
ncbi:hypothetical protein BKA62DRAFT_815480 [Auriculariales sp. MPI-PUGE-AT-0066]|nr:hypothetical protein BKA62DRAFT_815480 [Auriculariales sp. MPI-PUGE-AT-0066]